MDTNSIVPALEAVLFASGEPVPAARLSLIFAVPEEVIDDAAQELEREYAENRRGIRLLRLGASLQL